MTFRSALLSDFWIRLLLASAVFSILSCGQHLELPRPSLVNLYPTTSVQLSKLHESVQKSLNQSGTPAEKAAACADLGNHYMAFGFAETARSAYDQAKTLEPENTRHLYALGCANKMAGALDQAKVNWTELLSKSAYDFQANVQLGELLAQEAQWDQAHTCFERAVKVNPDEAVAYYGLGLAEAGKGNDKEAVGLFQRAMTLDAKATVVNQPLGQALQRLGEQSRADMLLRRKADTPFAYTDPLQTRIKAIVDQSLTAQALDMAGDHNNFDNTSFIAFIRTSFTTNPGIHKLLQKLAQERVSGSQPDNIEMARLHYAIGDLFRQQGEVEEALRNMTYAVQLDPGYKELFLDLGNTLLGLGRYDTTMKMMEAIFAVQKDHHDANILYNTARIVSGQPELLSLAVTDLTARVQISPEDFSAQTLLAQAHWAQKDFPAADAAFAKVLTVKMSDQEKADHFSMFARFLMERGELDRAKQALEKGLQYEPDSVDLKFQLAELQVQQKQYAIAASTYREVIAKEPRLEQPYVARAAALVLSQEYLEAINDLEDGLGACPDSVEIANLLARLRSLSPDEKLRDHPKALILARETYKRTQSARHAETYAIALAFSGNWDEAVSLQQALLASARKNNHSQVISTLASNLTRFQNKQLCCPTLDAETILGQKL